MARYQYVILSRAVDGELEKFERWYDEVHLADVLKVPGIISARRFRIISQIVEDIAAPAWCSLAIYEMETDDPLKVQRAIFRLSGSAAMPLTDALSMKGMVQLIASPAGEAVKAVSGVQA
jgi:hypothetical protein